MSLRDDLIGTLTLMKLPVELRDDTSLIRSGVLDSVALLNLVLWIEEQTGRPIDPTRINFRTQLDTVTSILGYVESHTRR